MNIVDIISDSCKVSRQEALQWHFPKDIKWDGQGFLTCIMTNCDAYASNFPPPIAGRIMDGLWVELRFIKHGAPPVVKWYQPCVEDPPWQLISDYNSQAYNCYFSVCPRGAQSGKAEDVALGVVLWADLDAKHFKGGKEEAWQQLFKPDLPEPSFIVDSGHGYHAYWNLEEAIELAQRNVNAERFRGYLNGIAKYTGGDHVHDLARVMRIPDTQNWKDKDNPVIASVVYTGRMVIAIEEFDHLRTPVQPTRETALTFDENLPQMDIPELRVSDEIKELILHPPQKGGRSEATFKVIAALHRAGYSPTEIKAVLKQNPIGERYYE